MSISIAYQDGLFHIPSVARCVSGALRQDGCVFSVSQTEMVMAAAMRNSEIVRLDDYLGPSVMFLVFADFVDGIGRTLGERVADDGFALDWAEDKYPSLIAVSIAISELCVSAMSAASATYESVCGYSFGDVFARMMSDGIDADEASRLLAQERKPPIKH